MDLNFKNNITKQNFNIQRVHLVSSIIFAVLGIFLFISEVTRTGIVLENTLNLLLSLALPIVAIIVYILKINTDIKSWIYVSIITIGCSGAVLLSPQSNFVHMYILIPTIIATLYFNTKYLTFSVVYTNIMVIGLYLSKPEIILGVNSDINGIRGLLIYLFLYNIITIALLLLTVWCKNSLNSTENEKEKNEILAENLANTMVTMKEISDVLQENIKNFSSNIINMNDSNNMILNSITEIAESSQLSAKGVNTVAAEGDKTLNSINSLKEESKLITMESGNIKESVKNGLDKIVNLMNQINIVNESIDNSLESFNTLQENMDNINRLLRSIEEFSSTTNILSINASIESSKAGQYGVGFLVIAQEIRKLSDDVKATIKEINRFTEITLDNSTATLKLVEKGKEASKDGEQLISEVANYFDTVNKSIIASNGKINNNNTYLNNIAKAINTTQEEMKNVTSVMEENNASTEEIVAVMENQRSSVKAITESVASMNNLVANLMDVFKNNK